MRKLSAQGQMNLTRAGRTSDASDDIEVRAPGTVGPAECDRLTNLAHTAHHSTTLLLRRQTSISLLCLNTWLVWFYLKLLQTDLKLLTLRLPRSHAPPDAIGNLNKGRSQSLRWARSHFASWNFVEKIVSRPFAVWCIREEQRSDRQILVFIRLCVCVNRGLRSSYTWSTQAIKKINHWLNERSKIQINVRTFIQLLRYLSSSVNCPISTFSCNLLINTCDRDLFS